ncbi:hypothetical protein NSK_001208 [Nannochloropsis salina CCMP1776]|uniref:Uncharacterized protein n=1 Tax=Nannochloropsis salina CCMP1776 TaxID=1027361 RepID=A0A4D9D823_9STRA|nr:hypothetical protein NSK_001208 [Nannochloropsis salina CCMP1776]|eukprot:TFJ87861.1 hypothetical protein NSK_001208 [Nannochloropsis salina CCMP1776]
MMAGAARRSSRTALALAFVLTTFLAQAFLAPKTQGPPITRRYTPAASWGPLQAFESDGFSTAASSVASPPSSTTLIADYFSTVDEIAASIGNTPWLQFFIPTAVGMSISLAIVFSLYLAAQPYEPPERK